MGRKIFIAVGSSAIKGMSGIIDRLKEEGVFEKSGKDIFIGLDSDSERLKALTSLDADRSKIIGVQITLSNNDPHLDKTRAFQPDWNALDISVSGVGGDRRKSLSCESWKDFWDQAKINLDGDETIALIGSAFGGTSTGLFWNMAEFIRSKINAGDPKKNAKIDFFALLLLPEDHPQQEDKYPVSKLFCAFLQDMQSIEWRNRLTSRMPEFKVPTLAKRMRDGDLFIPLTQSGQGASETSYLPTELVFLIPTPDNGQAEMPAAVAEVAMMLFYFGLGKKVRSDTIDRHTQVDNEESACFGGFNFICAKSGSGALLRSRYQSLLKSQWDYFLKARLPDTDNAIDEVYGIIRQVKLEGADVVDANSNVVSMLEKFKAPSIPNLERDLLPELESLRHTILNTPYAWCSIEELQKLLPEKEIKGRVTVDAISKAYKRAYDEVRRNAGLAEGKKHEIGRGLQKARRLTSKRGKSIMARIAGGSVGAIDEVRKKLAVHLARLFDEFKDACRSEATLKGMETHSDSATLTESLQPKTEMIEKHMRSAVGEELQGSARFIYEASLEDAEMDRVAADALSFKLDKVVLSLVNAKDGAEIDSILKQYEARGVGDLRKAASELGGNNPLKSVRTQIPVDRLESYSKIFRLVDSGKYHRHFYIERGIVKPIQCKDVQEKLKFYSFKTFEGMQMDNASFEPSKNKIVPEDGELWIKDNGQSVFAPEEIQGVWLGTLGLDFKIGKVLTTLYNAGSLMGWQKDASDSEGTLSGGMQRLMTLKTLVYLGCIIRAIEKSGLAAMAGGFDHLKLRIRIKGKDGKCILEDACDEPTGFGFEKEADRVYLNRIKASWVKKLTSWISRSGDESFDACFKLDSADELGGLLSFERRILTEIKMGLGETAWEKILKLAAELEKNVVVEAIR